MRDTQEPVLDKTKDLLVVKDLKTYFPVKGNDLFGRIAGYVKAIDGVSFSIKEGETFGLVGESGCGKTTIGKTILRLEKATAGSVFYRGADILKMSEKELRPLRKEMQIIFQDPYSSLDSRMTVEDIISEPMIIHKSYDNDALGKRVAYLLDVVGLAGFHARRYPPELSGGQRQRVGIARALALNPKFIVCDEPVSALDVSIQSQVLNLLSDLREEFGLSFLFIAHGMAVVKHISDRVGVMYLGKIVEISPKDKLYDAPMHPYTQALMSSIPIPEPGVKSDRIVLEGDVPSPINPPSGCRFHTRCPHACEACKQAEPQLVEVEPEHFVACHLVNQIKQ